MPAVRFPYFCDLPMVLLTVAEDRLEVGVVRRLLVDSGFTGDSSLILSSADCSTFGKRLASVSDVAGAIQGIHQRVWIPCAIPEIPFRSSLIAIAADLSAFSLPNGIDGLVGLSFLNQFVRWGAEQDPAGSWEFVLEK